MIERRSGDAGLSLVEVLVSLAIFAVIGIAGLAILNTVARTGERTEGRLERLSEIDRAFLIIRRDLLQLVPAAVSLDDTALAFRRIDGDGSVAVAFLADDATLSRRIGESVSGSVNQTLLSGTLTARWRLLDGSREWHSAWPPADANAVGRPLAAELTIELWRAEAQAEEDARETLTRLFLLPAGQGR